MKILKTSIEALEAKKREANALREMNMCPECGYTIERKDIWKAVTENLDIVFRANCPFCGCEWQSDVFL